MRALVDATQAVVCAVGEQSAELDALRGALRGQGGIIAAALLAMVDAVHAIQSEQQSEQEECPA